MKKQKGRPGKYEKKVKPYLERIKEMALQMTESQIAQTLGIAYSTFREYKGKHKELEDALKSGRKELVIDLKSTLIKKAKGFEYTEKKIIKGKNGQVLREEIYVKQSLPDVAAANLLLKNNDETWANDPQALALQKEELELKKKKAEANDWLIHPRQFL